VFVVAYGSMGGAERLWWLLRHFGHDECAVLVGGIEAWGGELRTGEEEIEPAAFHARERSGDTIDADEIARRNDLVVVDARLESRWRGEPNPIDVVPGRIPGAVNAPWNKQLADVRPGEVAAYCGSGITSCVTIHRLWLAGRDARLYPGSWSQWETLDLPVDRG
jgi:thiosulfate/3-mercaptopyruvate sulfurtransferase